jgi:Ca2+-transporting ATPase
MENKFTPAAANDHAATAWHTLHVEEVGKKLSTNLDKGLSRDESAHRFIQSGANALLEKPPRSLWRMLLDQFTDLMIMVLIVAAVISGVIGEMKDTVVIIAIVLLNALTGFIQEFRTARAMAALKQMTTANAQVMRDGERLTMPATEIVPGDIVLLEAGNLIPADLRLIETAQLKVDEALLTGESATVEKHSTQLENPELPLADRTNMAFKGTAATHGRGRGLVIATGMATELGKIAALLDAGADLKTPLQKRLTVFGQRLGIVVLCICLIILVAGLLRGEGLVLMLLTAISLAVAAIPEALPAVVTISLALGARKMVKQHALIRRLPAVETLGSVSYICSDKTGTLTQNKMHVEELYADGTASRAWHAVAAQAPWANLLTALSLSNDASRNKHGTLTGDPTETALYAVALEAGYDKAQLETSAPRLLEIPFDSERKRMTTVHRRQEGFVAYTKGAPENMLPLCIRQLTAEGEMTLSQGDILAQAERMAAEGLRVLAVAQRSWPALPTDTHDIEAELVFIGLVGLMDPPRHGVQEAVELCKSAGIIPVMITGDHPATARAIAARLGIGNGVVMTGPELARLSDGEFKQQVKNIHVYARVDPAQKIRIVEALQAHGEFVAMTGDGVNDAPALQRADIGIAMGRGGTDVAREAASMVLLDDNFSTIVHAVREGRRIFDNIRKFIKFVMTGNAGEIWTIFLAPFMGLPIPLLPIHILWVNLVTDGLPGLALTAEPAERGVMQRPPRPPSESIFAHGMWQHMLWVGLSIGAVSLFAQAWAIHIGSAHWQSMVFTVLTLSQMGHVLAIRSERESFFSHGLLSNPYLLVSVALTFLLQMATLYVPALNEIFHTQPLTVSELGICLALSSVVFFSVELEKLLVRRGVLYSQENGRSES